MIEKTSHHCVSGIFVLSLLILLVSACHTDPTADCKINDIDKASAHYQEHHDYRSLRLLLSQLDVLNTDRSEVESLLGSPVYCPMGNQCYYPTDESIAEFCPEGAEMRNGICYLTSSGEKVEPSQTIPIILVVQYSSSFGVQDDSDRLASFHLGPVGE
jgi:hypothetical protein